MGYGGKSICFLDLKVNIINCQLETTVYSKPNDSHLYLPAESCHKSCLYVYGVFAVQIMSIHLLQNNETLKGLFPKCSILVANKMENNRKKFFTKK